MVFICHTLIAVYLIALQQSGQNVQEISAPQADIFRVGNGVSAPVLLSKTEPEYSEEARRDRYQGSVTLYAQISPTGKAIHIKVVKGLGLGLDEKAVEAVEKWKFQPGLKEGTPVTVEATIEVNFRLLSDAWSIAWTSFHAAAGTSQPVLKAARVPPKCKSAAAKLTLSLTVHSDGTVTNVRIIDSSKPSLNSGIADSVKKLSFVPAMLGGEPQAVDGQIDVVCSVLRPR